jgi:EmrB/QacA subfamily drug resistance transporter
MKSSKILFSCSLCCFLAWLDFAIVNTALPAIETDFKATLPQLQWVMNAFVLSLTIFIVILGRTADHIGRKKMMLFGTFLFGLSSFLAAIAPTIYWLIFARFWQGVASAAIIPPSIALISHAYPGPEKAKAIGIWGAITGVAQAIGPALGGILVSTLNWRWIFWINIPLSLLALAVALIYTRESQEAHSLKPDLKGSCLLALALGSLIFTILYAPEWGWGWPLLSLFPLALFYYSEKRSPHPTIPFAIFSSRPFLVATLVMSAYVFIFTSVLFLLPLYLIQVRGQAPYEAGLTILSITAAIALLSPFSGHWSTKGFSKKIMLFGLALFVIGVFLLTFYQMKTPLWFILPTLLLFGCGWGIGRTPATTSAIASAPPHLTATATGVLWTVQNSAGALGLALTVTLFRALYELSPSPLTFMIGFRAVMSLLATVGLVIWLIVAVQLFKQRN